MNKLKIGISGVDGRMGRLIAGEVLEDTDLELVSAIETRGHRSLGKKVGDLIGLKDTPCPGQGMASPTPKGMARPRGPGISDDPQTISLCQVFIEFTTPQATRAHLSICQDKKVAMVIGTTGLAKNIETKIKQASSRIPIVYSPNMATGVNFLFHLAKEAARVLGKDFDIEIIEAHHHHKKDKPSGTAKKLAQIIGEARGNQLPSDAIHSIRKGEIVGEHSVILSGEGERIELIHRAESRRIFAIGAVKAAKFLAKASPGLYTMREVLCL